MIKSLCAVTREIDDPNAAVNEIMEALNLKHSLLKNTVGVVTCFSEFQETGTLEAICDALPFECFGSTTCLSACKQEIDQVMFAVTVLTSDDCSFKTALIHIDDNYETEIEAAVKPFIEDDKPALLLSYFPLMRTVSGDMILEAIDKVTGSIPQFGTMAVDHNPAFVTAGTIFNGKKYPEATVLCAIYGNVHATFEVASLDEDKFRNQKAVITESTGNILIGVNGKTVQEYLSELGLTKEDITTGTGILPLVVDHRDGTKPVVRAVITLTPEGYAVCGGAMPKGATLAIGRVDINDILSTTGKSLERISQKDSVILSYSCIARYHAMGMDYRAEAEKVREVTSGMNYLYACSGGEVCPLTDDAGRLKNTYHNYTNVICKLS